MGRKKAKNKRNELTHIPEKSRKNLTLGSSVQYSILKSKDITLPTKVHLVSSDQLSRSVVSDSATPCTTAHQASLSTTNSWSPPKPMSR